MPLLFNPATMPQVKDYLGSSNKDVLVVQADYSQIELYGLGLMARDEKLLTALTEEDFHTANAKRFFDVSDVTKELRTAAKAISFGIIYGASARKLAEQTGKSQTECKELVQKFYATYPKVKEWHEWLIHEADARGKHRGHKDEEGTPIRSWAYVTEYGKRYLFLEALTEWNGRRTYSFSPTKLKNWPVQGIASDINRVGLGCLLRKGYRCAAQIHDAVILYVTLDEGFDPAALAKVMTDDTKVACLGLGMWWPHHVDLKVEIEAGSHLSNLKKV